MSARAVLSLHGDTSEGPGGPRSPPELPEGPELPAIPSPLLGV